MANKLFNITIYGSPNICTWDCLHC